MILVQTKSNLILKSFKFILSFPKAWHPLMYRMSKPNGRIKVVKIFKEFGISVIFYHAYKYSPFNYKIMYSFSILISKQINM